MAVVHVRLLMTVYCLLSVQDATVPLMPRGLTDVKVRSFRYFALNVIYSEYEKLFISQTSLESVDKPTHYITTANILRLCVWVCVCVCVLYNKIVLHN